MLEWFSHVYAYTRLLILKVDWIYKIICNTNHTQSQCYFSYSIICLNLGCHYSHSHYNLFFNSNAILNKIKLGFSTMHTFNFKQITCHFYFKAITCNWLIICWLYEWCGMIIGHHNLEYRFYWARWVSNTFPFCNLAFELRSRVLILVFIYVIFDL